MLSGFRANYPASGTNGALDGETTQ